MSDKFATRDAAFEDWDQAGVPGAQSVEIVRAAFNAGWAARKQLDWECALGLRQPGDTRPPVVRYITPEGSYNDE